MTRENEFLESPVMRIHHFRARGSSMHNIFAVNRFGGTRFDIYLFFFFAYTSAQLGVDVQRIHINILYVQCVRIRAPPASSSGGVITDCARLPRSRGARVGWVTEATTIHVNIYYMNLGNSAAIANIGIATVRHPRRIIIFANRTGWNGGYSV